MKDFIHTGFHKPTLTTSDDPSLKVIEVDNGVSWTIKFYVGSTLIDIINMEYLNGSKLDENVLALRVFDEEDEFLGTVEDRLFYALDSYTL